MENHTSHSNGHHPRPGVIETMEKTTTNQQCKLLLNYNMHRQTDITLRVHYYCPGLAVEGDTSFVIFKCSPCHPRRPNYWFEFNSLQQAITAGPTVSRTRDEETERSDWATTIAVHLSQAATSIKVRKIPATLTVENLIVFALNPMVMLNPICFSFPYGVRLHPHFVNVLLAHNNRFVADSQSLKPRHIHLGNMHAP